MIPGAPGDSVRAAIDSVFAQPAYAWTVAPDASSRLLDLWLRLVRWLDGLASHHPQFFKVLVVGLVITLLGIVAHGIWTAWRTMRPTVTTAGLEAAVRVTREHREALDAAIAAHAAAGRYGDAMRVAFRRLATQLEGAGALAAQTGLTPREVVRAAAVAEGDRARLRTLVEQLYAVAFARRPCTADEFERWLSSAAAPWKTHAA